MLRDLLQAEEQGAGAKRIHSIVGQGVHDFPQRELNIHHGVEWRKVQAKGVGTPAILDKTLMGGLLPLMEITELLTTKGGRTTEYAIGLAMATGGTRHDAS